MEQRALGRTGLSASAIVLGAMNFQWRAQIGRGASPDAKQLEQAARTMRAAIEEDVTAIDTAPLYGFGASERIVGRLLREYSSSRPLVLTKVGLRWDDPDGVPLFSTRADDGTPIVVRRNCRPESILLELERSRERLGIEKIDVVQIHHRDPSTPLDESLGALADAVRAGEVGAIGVSNFDNDDIERAARLLAPIPLACVQSQLSLIAQGALGGALPAASAQQACFLAYSPLGQGLLTGNYASRELAADDWRSELPQFSKKGRASIQRALNDVVLPIARKHDATVSQIALAWVIAQPGCAAIAGASSEDQARQNARAGSIELEPDEIEVLGKAFAKLRFRGPGLGVRSVAFVKRIARRVLGNP